MTGKKLAAGVVAVGLLLICLGAGAWAAQAEPEHPPEVAQAREIVKEMGGELVDELKRSMEQGGVGSAATVCKRVGRRLARELSEKRGWLVGRTSLKARNPKNAPNPWETATLEEFEVRKGAGEDPETASGFEKWSWEEGEFRYMKAITVKELCLNCHGTDIAEDVRQRIRQFYEQDPACDYAVGDIRGAFTLIKPRVAKISLPRETEGAKK